MGDTHAFGVWVSQSINAAWKEHEVTDLQAQSINPWTGERVANYPYVVGRSIEQSLSEAVEVQSWWRRLPAGERTGRLSGLADCLARDRDRLALTITEEMGKPIDQAIAEVDKCELLCRHYADQGEIYLADEPIETEYRDSRVVLAPLGVLFSITPWNFPVWQILRFAVPTLTVGNTVIVKPAPNVVGCAREVVALADEAFGRAGILSLLNVDHPSAAKIIRDERISGVALTGSGRAGAEVAQVAGAALKKCLLELGGSDAFIVLDDADLETAAAAAVEARFFNSGQVCIAAKRILVSEPVYEQFLACFKTKTEQLAVGDPSLSGTFVGPMARQDLRETLTRQRDAMVRSGAKSVIAGGPVAGSGYLFDPAVVTLEPGDLSAGKHEMFGPLAVVQPFENVSEAVRIANSSPFGLTAMIWSKDPAYARRCADELDVGSVFINQKAVSDPRFPIGGVKQSGFGRELGADGVREFANVKTIVTA